MRHPTLLLSLSAALLLVAACAEPPEPVYDDDLGIQAIPADEGSLEGTFALKTVSATLVHIPVLGDQLGGGVNYRLVRRTWNPDEGVYEQRSRLCGGFNFEVAGVTTGAPESTYRAVPESTEEIVRVDHARGTYVAEGHVQLWGIELPDPLGSEFPANLEEAQQAPHAERIYDMDDDGDPGITLFVSGAVQGEVWAVQRKTVDLEGLLLGSDRMLGLAKNGYESVALGDDIAIYDPDMGSAEAWPDPKESWFEEVRVDDDADCEVVLRAEADGLIHRIRPF